MALWIGVQWAQLELIVLGPEWAGGRDTGCHLHGRQEPAPRFLANRHMLGDVPGAPWTSSRRMTELARHASASPCPHDCGSPFAPPPFRAQTRATPGNLPTPVPCREEPRCLLWPRHSRAPFSPAAFTGFRQDCIPRAKSCLRITQLRATACLGSKASCLSSKADSQTSRICISPHDLCYSYPPIRTDLFPLKLSAF